jgi:hypothetical protein
MLWHIYSTAGRAIAQAVSRYIPTTAAWVRSRVWSSGICGGQSGAGTGFLRVLRFPLPILIPQNSPYGSQGGDCERNLRWCEDVFSDVR